MSKTNITRKQANALGNYIDATYHRRYVPVRSANAPIRVGNVLRRRRDTMFEVSANNFPAALTAYEEGPSLTDFYVSDTSVAVDFSAAGNLGATGKRASPTGGLTVRFTRANQMFLLLRNVRQRSLSNYNAFRQEYLRKILRGEVPKKGHVVRGVIYADQYYVKYSRSGGTDLAFDLAGQTGTFSGDTAFSYRSASDKGRFLDGSQGGILGYRTSALRINRARLTRSQQRRILEGLREDELIASLSVDDAKAMVNDAALDLVDSTEAVILEIENA